MKKKLITCVLILCSLILIVNSAFAIQTYNVKYSKVFLEDEGYNQEKPGDYIQGLILTPMVITKAVCENHEIISN